MRRREIQDFFIYMFWKLPKPNQQIKTFYFVYSSKVYNLIDIILTKIENSISYIVLNANYRNNLSM